jgi:trimeric autotransporter adhesin
MAIDITETPRHTLTVSEQNWQLKLSTLSVAALPDDATFNNVTVNTLLTAAHIHGNIAGQLYAHVEAQENLTKGDPVYVSGYNNGTSEPKVRRAQANDNAKMPAIGVIDATYTAGQQGANCIISGIIENVNTQGFGINKPIYVGPNGGFTAIKPATNPQQVGICDRDQQNNGSFVITAKEVRPNQDLNTTSSVNFESLNLTNLTASGTVTAAEAMFNGLVSQTGLGGSTYFGEGAGVVDDLSANNNVGVGFQALKSNTTGNGNTAIGYLSLFSNTTGYNNTASGLQALRNNTEGRENTAIGYLSLFYNATGYNNTASGYASLSYNTTGVDNTASGYLAGTYIADGNTANQTSSTSIYLGADTKALANGDTNEIVIGYAATGIGSNTVTLGNSSIVTTALRGNVGIGTTTPDGPLHVSVGASGGTYTADRQLIIEGSGQAGIQISSTSTAGIEFGDAASAISGRILYQHDINAMRLFTAGSERVRLDATGNVGIGTTSPSAKLELLGGSPADVFSAQLKLTSSETTGAVNTGGSLAFTGNNGSGNSVWGYIRGMKANSNIANNDSYLSFATRASGGNPAEKMRIDASGNVGIGTTSPRTLIDLVNAGNTGAVATFDFGGTGGWNQYRYNGSTIGYIGQGLGLLSPAGSTSDFGIRSQAALFFAAGGATERMRITSTGNVGIGTTAPNYKLDIAGNVNVAGSQAYIRFNAGGSHVGNIAVKDEGGYTLGFQTYNSTSSTLTTKMVLDTNGNVGIGTITPDEKLDVVGNIKASGTVTAGGATFNGLVSQTGLGGSTYFGEGAGVVDDLSANNNVGVGFQALKSNITGSNNTASGYQSLCFNTTGSSNTASGYQSLRSNTTGSSNAASGHQSLRYNTTGPRNTASGYQSLYFNNTGINNTASGYQSLYFNTTGNSNTASGYLAGRYIADGTTANETSSTSIYLGAETKALANGDANEIVIGFDATGAGSNTATLGNASITKTVLRGDVETDGTVTAGAYNVATLPLTPSTGMRAYVTNSSVAASGNFGATVAAGGANIVPVFYDGTNWIIA